MKNSHPDFNGIIVNGDFVEHGVAMYILDNDHMEETWAEMKRIMTISMEKLRKNFEGSAILPTIGNNDVIVHNQVPCNEELADRYYKELFEVWFPKDGPLPKGFNYTEAKSTFEKGGYYSYSFPDSNIELIALNSMYYKKENRCSFDKGKAQLEWLKEKVGQDGDKKFVLSMHVFPGLNYYNNAPEIFWHLNETKTFLDILYPV